MIPYVIFETQTDMEGHTAFINPIKYDDENDAWSAFYLKLAAVIKSSVYMHTLMLCTADGRTLDSRCYMHGVNGEAAV